MGSPRDARPGRAGAAFFRLPALLAALAAASGPARTQAYEVISFAGTSAGDEFGRPVSGIGDLNGDGLADLAVGAPHAAPGGLSEQGQVQILSGSGGVLFALAGGSAGDHFGSSLARAGDVNGDGVPDLLAGAREASPGGVSGAGRAIVISGASGAALLVLAGASAGDHFGTSVAGPGDVNGDGVPDLLVGASSADPGGLLSAGETRLHSGANGALLSLSAGTASGDGFGHAVAGAGDVDGDGVLDLLVGTPQFGVLTATGPGYACAISGANGTTLLTFTGSSTGDWFGVSVAGGEDLDGDGVPEIAVGAIFASPGGIAFAGTATVFSGTSVLYTLAGPNVGANLGIVAFAGDVNADGVADLAVGAQHAAGAGEMTVISGASGAVLFVASGDADDDHFGSSVDAAGDLNGDGFGDVIVGAHEAAPLGLPFAGQAKVVSYAGIPPGSVAFGSGCAGSGGLVPFLQTGGGFPFAGSGNAGFVVALSRALGGTPATLVVGSSSLSPPLDLGLVGGGCSLLVSPDFLVPAGTSGVGAGAGVTTFPLPVPADPALAGAHVFVQGYVVDPGPGPLPGAMTGALDLVVLP